MVNMREEKVNKILSLGKKKRHKSYQDMIEE